VIGWIGLANSHGQLTMKIKVSAFAYIRLGVTSSFTSLAAVGRRHGQIRAVSTFSRSFGCSSTLFETPTSAIRDEMSPVSSLEAGKSSSEGMVLPAKGLESVWVKLSINGHVVEFQKHLTFGERYPRTMASLASRVKKDWSEDLVGISAARLHMHVSKDQEFLTVLDPSDIVSDVYGGETPTTQFS
jgi:hypothetical protein